DRTSSFFASRVLLVEGPTEVALIRKLMDEEKVQSMKAGVSVFDSMGKWNIHRFMNLFGALGIDHSVLYDDDESSGEHADVNRLIIESRNEFTYDIQPI